MKNPLRARLLTGQASINGWLSMPCGYSAELMARCGWNSLTVDLQHGVQDYASLVACFQATDASGIPMLARVPSNESGIIGKVLDAGAWGVICPMINSRGDCERFVASCLYPPLGQRSNGPNRASAFGSPDMPYQGFANAEILVLPMIETVEALDALDDILDVPGVSGAYVGPTDLAFSMGQAPVFDKASPEILATYERIVKAAESRGKFAGIHCMSSEYALKMAGMGFRLITVASDAALMTMSARDVVSRFHAGMAGS
ncbi:HpcH/HpaI aldolase family protein [Martelella soudanensis]|uniref:HpcH/HpaI aldolase family protein n=1 Tax=unclassified Martelella TaxID=2629616 RepID=UPI0015E01B28|nr:MULTISPECIES: aldolase/citrate lyase family protein [unclassified Martelella]